MGPVPDPRSARIAALSRRVTRVAHGAGRRIAVLLAGLTLIAAGLALLVLPGPGLLLLFAGLAVLSTEFEMARRAQGRLLVKVRRTTDRARGGSRPPA